MGGATLCVTAVAGLSWVLGTTSPVSPVSTGAGTGVLLVSGDPEGLPGQGDDDPVVVARDGGADMESHVARRHVEASAKGVIHFWARILEHTLITLYGRRYVRKGRYCILNVCQELLLSIEAGACSKDCWAGLRLGAKNRPHVGPDAVVQSLNPRRGKALWLVKDERPPGRVCIRGVLLDEVYVNIAVWCLPCERHSARVILPITNRVVAIVSPVVVDSPEPSVWSISPPVSCRIYSKLATDPLVGTTVIGVLEWRPSSILRKRCL